MNSHKHTYNLSNRSKKQAKSIIKLSITENAKKKHENVIVVSSRRQHETMLSKLTANVRST